MAAGTSVCFFLISLSQGALSSNLCSIGCGVRDRNEAEGDRECGKSISQSHGLYHMGSRASSSPTPAETSQDLYFLKMGPRVAEAPRDWRLRLQALHYRRSLCELGELVFLFRPQSSCLLNGAPVLPAWGTSGTPMLQVATSTLGISRV